MKDTTIIARHTGKKRRGGNRLPPHDHAAVLDGRTRYPSKVKDPDEADRLLKSGHNNQKIGKQVLKGPWKGMPIFTLTLEERATCPRSCLQWRNCYGNNLHLSPRWKHGRDLEFYLFMEVDTLAYDNPDGFVVRLHVLGDFYDEHYVKFWAYLMARFPQLRVFGFTARIDPDCPITRALVDVRFKFPDRWFVRFSDVADILPSMAAEVVSLPDHASPGSIVCPEQLGKTKACATCGLCWHSTRNITFLEH